MDKFENTTKDTKIILGQWQTCVEMANSVSQRRDSTNNIFITLNLAILATIQVTGNIKSLFLLASGIVFCGVWFFIIKNYRLLNSEKFKVIDSLESQLPRHPFREEWEKLQKVKKYKDGTFLEGVLPIIFSCIYGFAFLLTVKAIFFV